MVNRLDHRRALVRAAVLPFSKADALLPKAKALTKELREARIVDYDETQSIGKRYRRQDEVGTPYCITVDFETVDDQAVMIRHRDTMQQDRVALSKVKGYLAERLIGA